MNGKLSLLSAAVIMALAGTQADAKQNAAVKPTTSGPSQHNRGHFHRPAGTTVLYDQSGTSVTNVVSQEFGDFSAYSAELADDFVVTDAAGWSVSAVTVQENTVNATDPGAALFNVDIYPDNGGLPGATATCSYTGLTPTWDAGFTTATVPLGTACTLPQGTYWLAAVVAQNFSSGGQIYAAIGDTGTQFGTGPAWQNPGGAFGGGCTSWTPLATCSDLAANGFTATDAELFQIIGAVATPQDGISLTVGLAIDDGTAGQCGTATTLSVSVGDAVNYCYTVTNNSSIVLNYHTLVDDVPETIFTNVNVVLAPGASYQYNRVVPATASATIDSTWTAADQLPGYTPSAGTATFTDISTSGTALSTTDDSTAPVTMPFSFNFYGVTSNQLVVGNNGALLFGVSSGAVPYLNSSLPTGTFATPVLMPFWDDLYTGGNVYTQTLGTAPNRQFVVEYYQKNHYNGGTSDPGGITFEVVFNEADNTIDFIYDTVEFGTDGTNDGGASATVGLQYNNSTANQFSFDTVSLTDGQDILWTASTPTVYSASASVTLDVGAPVLALTPTSLSATAPIGGTVTQTLNIGNTGDRDLVWNLTEAVGGSQAHFPKHPVTLPAHSDKPASHLHAPIAQKVEGKSHPKLPAGTFAVPSYGETFSSSGFNYINFDASAPSNINQVATFSRYFFAGTFANNDFTVEYAVEYPTGELVAISTADGSIQNIGDTGLGTSVTGIRWDSTTGNTYLMAYDSSGPSAVLYTLDLATGTTTQVGSPASGLVIDIAIDPSGLMYGVDIIADALVAIDKTSNAQQAIGPIGFNANFAEGLDFDPSTGILYFAGYDADNSAAGMYTIDTSTGAATLVGALPAELDAFAIAVASGPCATPSDVPWLSENPISGTTAAGGTDPVTVTFDATGLSNGVYNANVCVNTNDTTNRQVAVPVTFTVTGDDTIFADGFDGT